MKHCGKCKTIKECNAFQKDKSQNDGLNFWCKKCRAEYNRGDARKATLERHRKSESFKKSQEKYNNSEHGRAKRKAAQKTDKMRRYYRAHRLKRLYGLTIDEYETMLSVQENRCAICGRTEADGRGGRFRVDHCHVTGEVRGLLCNECNSGLGLLGDNLAGVMRAADYLTRAFQQRINRIIGGKIRS